jgi:hypothetical protein
LKFYDHTGHAETWILNAILSAYIDGCLDQSEVSGLVILVNTLEGQYTAMHEIAQINAAKAIFDNSKGAFTDIRLESRTENGCELDIVVGNHYYWEVKPDFRNPESQMKKYDGQINMLRGPSGLVGTVPNIPVIPGTNTTMTVYSPRDGVIYYYFEQKDNRVPSTQVVVDMKDFEAMGEAFVVGCALSYLAYMLGMGGGTAMNPIWAY